MRTVISVAAILVAISFSALAIGACGGSASSDVVATVGPNKVTKTALNHWIGTLAGGDYYELSHAHTLPLGLVSEPPNYPACLTRLESLARTASAGQSTRSSVSLLTKCRQLYQALKVQAMTYLVNADWLIGAYSDEGISVSDAEVMQRFNGNKPQQFPTEAALHQYLAERRWTLADELYVIKLDLLEQKAQNKLSTGGASLLRSYNEEALKWTSKTTCSPGYVVMHCKQYKNNTPPSSPSPAVLMEQIATLNGVHCTNRQACAEQ
jgi:hypothetical protein